MKKYFITGLLIWIPLAITVWVLSAIVGTMDQSLRLLPSAIHPTNLLGFNLPGAGTVLTLLVILLTGVVATNIIGQRMVRFWEALLARIPVVKSIYYSVKQISDTLFSGSGEAFRKVPHFAVFIEVRLGLGLEIGDLLGELRLALTIEVV